MKGSSIFDDLVDVVTDQPMEDIQIEETDTPEEVVEIPEEVEEEQEIEVEDENVMSFYEYLKDNSLIDEIEGFTGSPEQLQEHLNKMPETYLNAAISTLHPDSQALFDYVVALGDKADKNELQKFFDSYLNVEEVDLTDEAVAYNYLEEKLKTKTEFKNPARLIAYLDSLAEDGTLTELASEIKAEEDSAKEEAKKKEVESLKEAKAKQEQAQVQFFNNIKSELDSYDWKDAKKKEILKNLDPNVATRKNQLIAASPKALIQLADIYARFNEKTGEFDLSDFEIKAASKKVQADKEQKQKDKLTSYLNKSVKTKGTATKEGFFNQFQQI